MTWRAVATVALLLTACAGATGPPAVRWGVDECSHCHMIVAEERFAAVARGPAGEEARFDDLGCLLAWSATRDLAGWQLWAHDAAGSGWLPAESAAYSRGGAATPMGSGLRAWPDGGQAAAAGAPTTWERLRLDAASPLPPGAMTSNASTPNPRPGSAPSAPVPQQEVLP
jgi:copper chaperone NosL